MPFTDGKYRHSSGFTILVNNGEVMLSTGHPLSMRLSDLFDVTKWEKIS